jgi:hypothetical protein
VAGGKGLFGGAAVCFSAEMDVAAGLAVGAIGVHGLRHARRPPELALGMLPVLFGAHQLTEAFVWWGDSGLVAPSTARTAVWVYMAFAYVVLPVLVPMVVLWAEPDAFRRRVVARFGAVGAVVALLYLQAMLGGPVSAVVDGNRIAYHTGLGHGGLVAGLYMLATVGALLSSSHPRVVAFGKANLIALPALALLYTEALASLWCAWAAVTSIIIAAHLREAAATRDASAPTVQQPHLRFAAPTTPRRSAARPRSAGRAGNRPEVGDRPVEAGEHPLQLLGLLGRPARQSGGRHPGAGHEGGELLDLQRRPDDPGSVPTETHVRPPSP